MLYRVFSKLGWTGFGGPIVTIAHMRREALARGWCPPAELDALITLCKLLPGPASFQLSVALGFRQKGWRGALIAPFLFSYPALVLVTLGAVWIQQFGTLPWMESFLRGMQPALWIVILQGGWQMLGTRWKKPVAWILFLLTLYAYTRFPLWEPAWILLAGALAVLYQKFRLHRPLLSLAPLPLLLITTEWDEILRNIAWSCLKAGTFLFGTGLAIVPLLEHDFVTRWGYLDHSTFSHGVSLGLITPGPVISSAAYFGYMSIGWTGALVASIAVFLPSFFMILCFLPFTKKVLNFPWVEPFFDGALPAIAAAVAVTVWHMTQSTHLTATDPLFALGAAIVLVRFRAPAWAVLLSCGCLGLWFH